jgi:hypothetical protein
MIMGGGFTIMDYLIWNELPTVLGNLVGGFVFVGLPLYYTHVRMSPERNFKTSLNGAYHAFDFSKYAHRYLAAIAYRFNRRFILKTLPERLLIAAVTTEPRPAAWLRLAEDSY